jgi:hypothetical protein
MDVLIWLAASATTLASYGIGHRRGRRHTSSSPSSSGVKATCGCTHELAHHDPETGRCHYAWGFERSIKCTCRQYTGPRPIDQVFQPGILMPREET